MINPKKTNTSSGFTIIEALFGVFIFLLIALAVIALQTDIFSLNTILSGGMSSQQEARTAFKKMTAEIRTASISNNGAYPIEKATATEFIFFSDIDDDQLKERVRYFLDGTTLKKGVVKPAGSPLVYNLASEKITELIHYLANGATPIFSYYDTNYDGTTDALTFPVTITTVRLVKITTIIDRDASRAPSPITVITQVNLRNLKDNL